MFDYTTSSKISREKEGKGGEGGEGEIDRYFIKELRTEGPK